MFSSGQRQVDRVESVFCGCGFDGDVDVFYDPEVHFRGWQCPNCGVDFEEEFYNEQ